jgi:hypothetical protein
MDSNLFQIIKNGKLGKQIVGNSEKTSEALKIQNGQFEKRRFRDSISASSGPTQQLIESGFSLFPTSSQKKLGWYVRM